MINHLLMLGAILLVSPLFAGTFAKENPQVYCPTCKHKVTKKLKTYHEKMQKKNIVQNSVNKHGAN